MTTMYPPDTPLVLGTGIEDTCVYPADPLRAVLDEHDLTDHTANWRADLEHAAGLGARTLRYGASWPVSHTGPGRFDWHRLDPVVEAAAGLGLQLMIDLVHYGTPPWLARSFADPEYPAAIEEFTRALLTRYRGSVAGITPLNEPLTTASFCGLRGVWPPHRLGWEGWVETAVPMALGIVRTIDATRRLAPETSVVHVEAGTLVTPAESAATGHAHLLEAVGWLPTDLALGRVTPDHPMHEWLIGHGAHAGQLRWLHDHAQPPDVLGVNYYPDLTPRQVRVGSDGAVQVAHNRWSEGLSTTVRRFAERYGLPLAITETSIEGPDDLRTRWLIDSFRTCLDLRADGIDLRGYTWWPLFDFVDWSWAAGGANVEEFAVASVAADGTEVVAPAASLGTVDQGKAPFLRRMGLVRLDERADGTLRRLPTVVAERYRDLAEGRLP